MQSSNSLTDGPRDDTERGWQNVARSIRRQLRMLTPRSGEPELHPVEQAELDAWMTAQKAVIDGIEERMTDAERSD